MIIPAIVFEKINRLTNTTQIDITVPDTLVGLLSPLLFYKPQSDKLHFHHEIIRTLPGMIDLMYYSVYHRQLAQHEYELNIKYNESNGFYFEYVSLALNLVEPT